GAGPDPGGDAGRAAVREELEVDGVGSRAGARLRRPPGGRGVRGPGPDRRRHDCEGERGEGGEGDGHRRRLGTSSKSGRKLSAAAAAPATSATQHASRAGVAGSAEITTPCQKTGSEPRLAAA